MGLTSGQTEASFWNAGTEPDMPVGNRDTLKVGEIRQLYDRDDFRSLQLYGQLYIKFTFTRLNITDTYFGKL